jgi:hypothetical protein
MMRKGWNSFLFPVLKRFKARDCLTSFPFLFSTGQGPLPRQGPRHQEGQGPLPSQGQEQGLQQQLLRRWRLQQLWRRWLRVVNASDIYILSNSFLLPVISLLLLMVQPKNNVSKN